MRRLCLEPGCPDPPLRRGRCATHASGANRASRQRRSHRTIYSTKRWTILRRRVLNEEPICGHCTSELSTQVDHIIPLDEGGAPYKRDNLQGLCRGCHSIKTRTEMA